MENRDLSIVIPFQYGGSKWENNELRYTLRSLSSNLNFNYDITIYSDKPIDWLKNVRVEVVDRYYPKQALKKFNNIPHYENFYDTLNKLRVISNDVELCEDILYVYDDILLMKPQNLEQVKVLYAGSRFEANKEYWLNPGNNKWKNTIFNSIRKARGFGEVFIYETHLPRHYQKSKIKEMFKMFPIDQMDIPYAPATLYFNMFYNKPNKVYAEIDAKDNDVKAGFYGPAGMAGDSFLSKTKEEVESAVVGKTWINYSDAGLTDHLKEFIQKQYPKKCKYER